MKTVPRQAFSLTRVEKEVLLSSRIDGLVEARGILHTVLKKGNHDSSRLKVCCLIMAEKPSSRVIFISTTGQAGKIYTEWANRYLSKAPDYKPIVDICNELRDYRLVAKLIQVVVPDNVTTPQFISHLSRVNTNIDGLNVCLQYLAVSGVNSGKVSSRGQVPAISGNCRVRVWVPEPATRLSDEFTLD
ncbi:hypothetical protein KIN20_023707 [Parelaphostrongylus tenuis]|uniref:Uncharacterized protein n=1 Tax=Parelaphostrongylus tenuis TaxID=148309 RepID=A0AAD5QVZ7_PARTN|nr:hypothetical protein KIN20_023707 [Parelaphostrongylus tenuis]